MHIHSYLYGEPYEEELSTIMENFICLLPKAIVKHCGHELGYRNRVSYSAIPIFPFHWLLEPTRRKVILWKPLRVRSESPRRLVVPTPVQRYDALVPDSRVGRHRRLPRPQMDWLDISCTLRIRFEIAGFRYEGSVCCSLRTTKRA